MMLYHALPPHTPTEYGMTFLSHSQFIEPVFIYKECVLLLVQASSGILCYRITIDTKPYSATTEECHKIPL